MFNNKILKFIKMNKYEKNRSIVRNTFRIFNKRKFKNIGKKSYFLSPQFLSGTKYIYLGEDVGIWNDARVECIDEWEGRTFTPEVKIGNHVNIGQNLHLTCASSIIIEDNVLCSARVTIMDISHESDKIDIPLLSQGILTKPIRICEGAFIGINSTVMPGVTIGKYAIVGANTIVTKDVPDYAVVVGIPARVIKYRNE